MEHIYHIRYQFNIKGKSIRAISKETGHDRQTVKKFIEQENFSIPTPIKRTRTSKTTVYRDLVRQWLIDDQKAPRKQWHTARRVFNRLREIERRKGQEIDVSERAIRDLVAMLKVELGQNSMASLPLLHPAGEAQVDFGQTHFFERGISYVGYHLALTMPHSDAKFVQLYKGQTFECLAQGLMNIFNHIGFVPTIIRFDNMSTAVKAIKAYGEREVTDNFRRLQCHFGFESNFCNPASGNEKGSVENYVGYSRRNYFVPLPDILDLEEYNRELLKLCQEDLDHEHYKLERSVLDLFEEDKAVMKALPHSPFESSRYVLARTNAYGMAKFDTNSYSILKSCEFVKNKQNLILYGRPGTGKSHLASALGVEACRLGHKTIYYKTSRLVNLLSEARKAGTEAKFWKRLSQADVLILDEWGYIPFERVGTQLLFEAISDCYEKRSVIITTNLPFDEWNTIFYDQKLTTAILDRLVHHGLLLMHEGQSYRLQHAKMQ